MSFPPVFNPPIPCVGPIPNGMYPGRMLRIQGGVPHGSSRFEVNLICGPGDVSDDVPFHISVRFDEGDVVRNHFEDDWGREERGTGLPLAPGQNFELLILCEPQGFKMAFNGRHYCDFFHRLPFEDITHLGIKGHVAIHLIAFEG